jgi:hypothetical protein
MLYSPWRSSDLVSLDSVSKLVLGSLIFLYSPRCCICYPYRLPGLQRRQDICAGSMVFRKILETDCHCRVDLDGLRLHHLLLVSERLLRSD